MTILFVILIIIASAALGFFVLVQNPKGGGLAGSIGGFSNQFMGVKQTNDVLEKGTWIFATVIGVLCLFSTVFLTGSSKSSDSMLDRLNTNPTNQAAPMPLPDANKAPNTTTLPDSGK